MRRRNIVRNIWPFDSFSKTTYYNIRKGTKSTTKPAATKWNYKGYSIRKTFDTYSGETYYTVPKLDPDSQFDSLMDAKRFIGKWVSNPSSRRIKNTVVVIKNPARWFRYYNNYK